MFIPWGNIINQNIFVRKSSTQSYFSRLAMVVAHDQKQKQNHVSQQASDQTKYFWFFFFFSSSSCPWLLQQMPCDIPTVWRPVNHVSAPKKNCFQRKKKTFGTGELLTMETFLFHKLHDLRWFCFSKADVWMFVSRSLPYGNCKRCWNSDLFAIECVKK